VKVILDTNILMSAIFWGGKPRKIVDLWLTGAFVLVASKEIVAEYDEIFHRLNKKYKTADEVLFNTIVSHLQLYTSPILAHQVCEDPDDDKFLACAMVSAARYIVSGDKLLLQVETFGSCQIITASDFLSGM